MFSLPPHADTFLHAYTDYYRFDYDAARYAAYMRRAMLLLLLRYLLPC